MIKKFLTLITLSILFFASVNFTDEIKASEGIFELQNVAGEEARCHATSVLMSDQQYHLLVSCRDITYPGAKTGTDIFSYVLWGRDIEGKVTRLGALGVGKVALKAKKPFVMLFVTREQSETPKKPNGETVMSGNLQNINFLDSGVSEFEEIFIAAPTPTPKPKSGMSGLQFAGTIAFAGLFASAFILFLLTRR